jgi:CHRD domain-containing protein
MQRIRLFTLIIALTLIAFSSQVSAQSGHKLSAKFTGAAEVPGPGDPDGGGKVTLRMNESKGEICFQLTVSKIAAATAAHIHEAPTGQAGPPVVTLTPLKTKGSSKGCVSAGGDLIKRIWETPANFYVNVHTGDFPDGAVRGQLGK